MNSDTIKYQTQWIDACRRSLNALAYLFDHWDDPRAHAAYDAAVRAEKTAEHNYRKFLTSRLAKLTQQ